MAEDLSDPALQELFPGQPLKALRQRLSLLAAQATSSASEPEQIKLPVQGEGKGGVFVLHTDGASRGNPGEAGAGACIFDQGGNEVHGASRYLGRCTNNVAEYQALLLGLQAADSLKIEKLDVRLDSELIVRQLQGRYRVKDAKLQPLYKQVKTLTAKFGQCRFSHVPRSENARADELANQAIDQKAT
jgi:ribonuclease HI